MERVGWLARVFAVGCLLAAALLVGDGAGGGPAHASRAATIVRLPAPYSLPSEAVWVHNSRQLVRALAHARTRSIVLADGVYNHGEPFYVRRGNRLYSARLGQAVLRAGIVLGANNGPAAPLLRGLRFDVRDPRRTLNDNVIHVWGSASRAHILDTRVAGHGRIDAGIFVRQVDGFVAKRVVVRGFRSFGVLVDPNTTSYRARRPYLLEDVTVSRVGRPTRGSSHGTAEACIWLGSRGVVRRTSARRCGLEGIWTGTGVTDSLLQDVEVDRSPVGIYVEHFTRGTTFERLRIGPHVVRGVNAEWADPAWGRKPASIDNTFRNSTFATSLVGVYLDEGTTRTSVLGCRFTGQSWAGIGNYLGIGNRFAGNDFKGLLPEAVPISLGHL
jgi:hypothetical protein